MISVSKSNSRLASGHSRFEAQSVNHVNTFLKILTSKVWSPITWENGYRAKNNFRSCKLIVLDFDTGEATLESVKKDCEDFGLSYILATTKSHQIEKTSASGDTKPAVDRFRLVLFSEKTCHDRELYEYNMKQFTDYWPCDSSCTDGARFFWPCKRVVSYQMGLSKIPWLEFDDDYVPERYRYINYARKLRHQGNHGIMPEWIHAILTKAERIPIGERHKTCYRLGATWNLLGWELDELVGLVEKTSLNDIDAEYKEGDMLRALQNGFDASEGIL